MDLAPGRPMCPRLVREATTPELLQHRWCLWLELRRHTLISSSFFGMYGSGCRSCSLAWRPVVSRCDDVPRAAFHTLTCTLVIAFLLHSRSLPRDVQWLCCLTDGMMTFVLPHRWHMASSFQACRAFRFSAEDVCGNDPDAGRTRLSWGGGDARGKPNGTLQ